MITTIIELLKLWLSVTIGIVSGAIFITMLVLILSIVIMPPKGSDE